MGQRSQIYVRFTNPETGRKKLVARYFGWNYGERMVSRVRNTIEFIECQINSTIYKTTRMFDEQFEERLVRIMETNFDLKDVQFSGNIIREYEEMYLGEMPFKTVFIDQDNNDGQAFIDVTLEEYPNNIVERFGKSYKDYKVKIRYAFTESTDSEKSLTPYGYLKANLGDNWQQSDNFDEDDITAIRSNIEYLDEFELIPPPELEEYRDYDYLSDAYEGW